MGEVLQVFGNGANGGIFEKKKKKQPVGNCAACHLGIKNKQKKHL